MTQPQILGELKKLTNAERLAIADAALHLGLQESSAADADTRKADFRRRLTAAAEALRSDYETDSELTIFTALDGEDCGASR